MSELSDKIKNNPPKVIKNDNVYCSRCGKELSGQTYGVAGFEGTYGHQCALQICQGRTYLLRKKQVIRKTDWDGELPF